MAYVPPRFFTQVICMFMLFGPLSKAAPNLYSNLWDFHLLSQGHPPRQLHVVIPVIHWTLVSEPMLF